MRGQQHNTDHRRTVIQNKSPSLPFSNHLVHHSWSSHNRALWDYDTWLSNYDAASIIVKAKRPWSVQPLHPTHTVPFNECQYVEVKITWVQQSVISFLGSCYLVTRSVNLRRGTKRLKIDRWTSQLPSSPLVFGCWSFGRWGRGLEKDMELVDHCETLGHYGSQLIKLHLTTEGPKRRHFYKLVQNTTLIVWIGRTN